MHAAHDMPDQRRSVVYLESAPSLAFPDIEPQRAVMDQRNETFVPHVLAITVGTTVDFPNNDNVYHNVFSLRGPKPFDLGRYAAGRSRSVRFDRPGIVRVFCEIHSHMSAFILVFNHRYFAVTAPDGRYQINRVPAGRYTLVAWNEGSIRESRPVVIGEDGGAVEADFALR
jgi:plastocyanin